MLLNIGQTNAMHEKDDATYVKTLHQNKAYFQRL